MRMPQLVETLLGAVFAFDLHLWCNAGDVFTQLVFAPTVKPELVCAVKLQFRLSAGSLFMPTQEAVHRLDFQALIAVSAIWPHSQPLGPFPSNFVTFCTHSHSTHVHKGHHHLLKLVEVERGNSCSSCQVRKLK